MYAADLAHPCQTLDLDCDAVVAARLLAVSSESFLVLVDSSGEPLGFAHAQEVLRHLLPSSLTAHPGLISLTGPFARAHLARGLSGRRLVDLLPPPSPPLLVTADTGVTQVLARLTRTDSPAAVVVNREGARPEILGIITAQRLLRVLFEERGAGDDGLLDSAAAVLAASRLLVAVSARSLAEVEETLTLLQFRLMVVLGVSGPASVQRLSGLLGVEARVVRRLVEMLLSSELVQEDERVRDCLDQGYALSPRGLDLVHDVTRRRMEAITRILESMPEAERTALAPVLRAFARAAGEPSAELVAAALGA
ncbi:CBS domain-containing protein [Streptomyces mesophilus]|uniref:CBS domain-containing protein n=1 Tax=Streptomyces mesophilus TaxID=1775132 RepID=UPI003334A3E4